jgi:hypothetical protein
MGVAGTPEKITPRMEMMMRTEKGIIDNRFLTMMNLL